MKSIGSVTLLIATLLVVQLVGAQNGPMQVTVSWTCAGNGDWNSAYCWSTGQLPTPEDVVYISGGPHTEVSFFQGGYEPYTTPPNTVKGLIIDGNGFVFGVEGMRMLVKEAIVVQNGAMIDVGYPTELYSANLTVVSNSIFQNDWGTFVSFDLVEIGPDGSSCTFTMDGSLNTSVVNLYSGSSMTYTSQYIPPFWYPNWVEAIMSSGTLLWQNGTEISPKVLNNGTMIFAPKFSNNVELPFASLMATEKSVLVFQGSSCNITLEGDNYLGGRIGINGANLILSSGQVDYSGVTIIASAPSSLLSIDTLFIASNGSDISGSVNVMSQGNLQVGFGTSWTLESLSITGGTLSGGGEVAVTGSFSVNGGATIGKNTSLIVSEAVITGTLDLGEGASLEFDTASSVSFACPEGTVGNCTVTIGSPRSSSRVINDGDFYVNSTDGSNTTSWVSSVEVYSDFTNSGLVYVSFALTGDYSSALSYHTEYLQEEGATILHSGVMMFDKPPTIVAGGFPEQCESFGSEYICKTSDT